MSQKTILLLTLITILVLYLAWHKSPICFNFVFIRQIETKDNAGHVFIHDHNSPLIVIGGISPYSTHDTIAEMIEAHPDIKECKNRTIALSQMLGRYYERLARSDKEFNALIENGVLEVYDKALSAYILEILTKQGKAASKILCTRESELLTYCKEIHRIFPNSKFIHVFMAKEEIIQGLAGKSEVFVKKMIESAESIKDACSELGNKTCLQISAQGWKHNGKTIQDIFNFAVNT